MLVLTDYSEGMGETQKIVSKCMLEKLNFTEFYEKAQHLSTFQRFFYFGILSGYEKKLYFYRIWLEKLRKHFTNP